MQTYPVSVLPHLVLHDLGTIVDRQDNMVHAGVLQGLNLSKEKEKERKCKGAVSAS